MVHVCIVLLVHPSGNSELSAIRSPSSCYTIYMMSTANASTVVSLTFARCLVSGVQLQLSMTGHWRCVTDRPCYATSCLAWT